MLIRHPLRESRQAGCDRGSPRSISTSGCHRPVAGPGASSGQWEHRPAAGPGASSGRDQPPVIDQCHGSDGRFTNPYPAACAASHVNPALLAVRVRPPEVMSTARPISCSDRPGIAVGTRHEEAGAVQTSGQPLIVRSSICRCLVRNPPPDRTIPSAFASSSIRRNAYATFLCTVMPYTVVVSATVNPARTWVTTSRLRPAAWPARPEALRTAASFCWVCRTAADAACHAAMALFTAGGAGRAWGRGGAHPPPLGCARLPRAGAAARAGGGGRLPPGGPGALG